MSVDAKGEGGIDLSEAVMHPFASPRAQEEFASGPEWQRCGVNGASNKRIWPTEFGWAAGGALDPRYGYANYNTY